MKSNSQYRSKKKSAKKRGPSGLQPFRNSGAKVKRNQPCPCKSGLKAKRCCLKRIQTIATIPPHLRAQFIADCILQQPIGTIEEPKPIESKVNAADCQLEITSEEQP